MADDVGHSHAAGLLGMRQRAARLLNCKDVAHGNLSDAKEGADQQKHADQQEREDDDEDRDDDHGRVSPGDVRDVDIDGAVKGRVLVIHGKSLVNHTTMTPATPIQKMHFWASVFI